MFLAGSCGYDLFGKTMQSKITLKKSLFIASIMAIVFIVAILFLAPVARGKSYYAKLISPANIKILQNPVDAQPVVPVAVAQQESVGLPVRLKIPEINVDATIEYVGLKANGEMDVPKDPADVAWLQIGNRPGDIGSAVIAGHYGRWKNGEGSVFDNLKKLNKGDQLYIEDDKGTTITFVVRENRSYEADADASNVFTSSDGKSHLNLVTCQDWDEVSESYFKRLVIFTDKE